MRENLKKNVFIIWNVFSKIAIISISITSKLVDWIFPVFISLLLTCLIYPHKFKDFILFFFLIYRDYKCSVSLFLVFLVLCFITKQIEKNISHYTITKCNNSNSCQHPRTLLGKKEISKISLKSIGKIKIFILLMANSHLLILPIYPEVKSV